MCGLVNSRRVKDVMKKHINKYFLKNHHDSVFFGRVAVVFVSQI